MDKIVNFNSLFFQEIVSYWRNEIIVFEGRKLINNILLLKTISFEIDKFLKK
jgi:hypothetical protein